MSNMVDIDIFVMYQYNWNILLAYAILGDTSAIIEIFIGQVSQ